MKRKKSILSLAALGLSAVMAGGVLMQLPPSRRAIAQEIQALEAKNQRWEEVLDSYNEKWTGQSENCAGSMPVGGGNLALNVWAEGDEVIFYLGSTDSIDEHLVIEKLGRVRIRMSPNPFTDGLYTQELKLRQGYIEITGSNADNSANIDIWTDVYNGTVNVEIENSQPTTVTAVYENWRTEDNKIEIPSYAENYYSGMGKYMFKDTIEPVGDNEGLMFYHRNRTGVGLYEDLVEQQGLSDYVDQLINPMENYTFGGFMKGTNMQLLDETYEGRYASTDFTAWQMQTTSPQKKTTVKIYTLFDNYATADEFVEDLLAKEATDAADTNARKNTEDWWNGFWGRSWVLPNYSATDKSDNLWQVGRHYAMTRHQLGCYAFSRFPSKFNGGPFSFDPEFCGSGAFQEEVTYGTPDFRFWGGGTNVAQNQRHLTWPMLRSGDWEIMTSQFDYYNNGLNNNKIATQEYWGHDGAAYCEHFNAYGLIPGQIYGWDRPLYLEDGEVTASVKNQYNGQLEFSYQMLLYHDYSGADIGEYIDFITSCTKFFYEHYTRENLKNTGNMFDENGKLVIYPSTAMETYKNATNPVDVVAALHVVVNRLIDLSSEYPEIDKAYFENMKSHLPSIDYTYTDGKKVILPADSSDSPSNFEMPEMSPVWPYGVINLSEDEIEYARNTWDTIPGEMNDPLGRRGNADWEYAGTVAARLGMADVAGEYLLDRMHDCDYFRYPGFKVIEAFDWSPNIESSCVGMTMAQEMILQDFGDDIYLLPSWRSDWELNAKLHAAFGTSVTVTQSSEGKIEFLKVEQSSAARESVTLHFRGIDDPAVKVYLSDGSEVNVTRGDGSITFSVEEGEAYYVSGIPAAGLNAPENLKADKINDEINGKITAEVNLSWTSDPLAVSYNIYRKDTNTDKLELVGVTENNYYVDEGLSEALGYYYQVTAVNSEGTESLPSALTAAEAKYIKHYFVEDFETTPSGENTVYKIFKAEGKATNSTADAMYTDVKNGGKAFNFNNDRYIELTADPLELNGPFEFSAKIYYSWTDHHLGGTDGSMRLLDCSSGDNGFLLDIIAGNNVRLIGGTAASLYYGSKQLTPETWIDFNFRYIPSEKRAIVTANGVEVLNVTLGTELKPATVPLRIGGDYGNNGITWWNFGGAMDDISIVLEDLNVAESNSLQSIRLVANNSLSLGEKTQLSVVGIMSDGSEFSLDGSALQVNSSNLNVLGLKEKENLWTVTANAVGSGAVDVVYSLNGKLFTAKLNITVQTPDDIESLVISNDGLLPRTADVARITTTGLSASGETYDLTYAVTYEYDASLISISNSGYVRILKSGNGELKVSILSGGKKIETSTTFECTHSGLLSIEFEQGKTEVQDSLDGNYTAKLCGDATAEGSTVTLAGGYVEISGSEDIDFSESFTISADFYVDEVAGYFRLFDAKTPDPVVYDGFMVDVRPNGALRFMHSTALINLTYVIPVQQWFNLAVSYDADNSIARIYVNGEAVENIKNCILTDYPQVLRVGANGWGSEQLYGKVANIEMSTNSIFFSGFSVNVIEVESESDKITEIDGTMQFTANVLPQTARNRMIVWSVEGLDGKPTVLASISEQGVLSAHANGIVVVKATSRDGSGIFGSKQITISGQLYQVVEEDGFDGDKWIAHGGDWQLNDDGELVEEKTTWETNYAFNEDISCVSVKADFLITDTDELGYVGFQLLFDDEQAITGKQNGFFVGVELKGRIFIYVSGRGEMDANPVLIPGFDYTKPFTLQATMVDDYVVVFFNGEKLLEHRNAKLVAPQGTVAIYAGVKSIVVNNFSMQYLNKPYYTASFQTEGGSIISTQSIKAGDLVQKPANPTYKGYVFEGWYLDSDCTKEYDFDSQVVDNVVLYAKWSEQICTVTFNSMGGSNVESDSCTYGGTISKPANPKRKGYKFEGWYSDKGLEKAYDFDNTLEGDITLYAKWSKSSGCASSVSGQVITLSAISVLFAAGTMLKKKRED